MHAELILALRRLILEELLSQGFVVCVTDQLDQLCKTRVPANFGFDAR